MNALVISIFANVILGSGAFEKIKEIVQAQSDKAISGTAKRTAAVKELEKIGIVAGTSLINLGIELAVAWLKLKSK
jgi:hypothetical protein